MKTSFFPCASSKNATVAIFWLTRCPNFDWCNSLRRWNPAHRPYVQWEIMPGWWMLLEVMNHTENWGCWRWCKQTSTNGSGHSDLAMCPKCVSSSAIPSAVGNSTCSMIALLSGSRATAELCAEKSAVAFRTLDWWKHILLQKISVQIRYLHTGTFVSSVSFTAKNRHLLELLALSAANEGQVDLDNPRQS